jgi:hypothetical protein
MKNTSTDEGNKPEKVYKYDDWDGLSDSDDSQELSPSPASARFQCHPTSRCPWRLPAKPSMCMTIV